MIQRIDDTHPGSPQPEPRPQDYLPARMINEFVYCPRLFFLEHVEGLFAHNADTIDGAIKHKRVDQSTKPLPKASSRSKKAAAAEPSAADQASDQDQNAEESVFAPMLHARSVTLASDQYQILAKLDLVEAQGDVATPVDYKRGRPRLADDGSPEAWEPEQVQVCVQALVLRDNGYQCEQGIIYYAETKQRIPVPISEQLIARTLDAIAEARRVMAAGQIPPPLVESPKCPRCSLVGICLPDESLACAGPAYFRDGQGYLFDVGPRLYQIGIPEKEVETGVRRLIAARDDRRPLYINTPGLTLGKSSEVLQVKEKGKT
ncbi:MAG TPA: CRISPR-associated protein Cas4, partial [Pirellulaceae bacterium]|nr:CRISPR-associated protein Cas4 [Pirellulaceae bacterium]